MTEDDLEQICIDWFKELGWDYECGYDIAPDSDFRGKRERGSPLKLKATVHTEPTPTESKA